MEQADALPLIVHQGLGVQVHHRLPVLPLAPLIKPPGLLVPLGGLPLPEDSVPEALGQGAPVKAVRHHPAKQLRGLQCGVDGGIRAPAGPHQIHLPTVQAPAQLRRLAALVDPQLLREGVHPLGLSIPQKVQQNHPEVLGVQGQKKGKHPGGGGVSVEEQAGLPLARLLVEELFPLIGEI